MQEIWGKRPWNGANMPKSCQLVRFPLYEELQGGSSGWKKSLARSRRVRKRGGGRSSCLGHWNIFLQLPKQTTPGVKSVLQTAVTAARNTKLCESYWSGWVLLLETWSEKCCLRMGRAPRVCVRKVSSVVGLIFLAWRKVLTVPSAASPHTNNVL